MGSLKDQFKKAGLLSKTAAKRLAHEERVVRKEKGRDAVVSEEKDHQRELSEKREDDKARVRAAQAQLDAERRHAEKLAEVRELVRSRAVQARGPRRFHFVARSGHVPSVGIDPDVARQLETGQIAIVVDPQDAADGDQARDRHVLVERATAQRVLEVDAKLVRFLAGVTR